MNHTAPIVRGSRYQYQDQLSGLSSRLFILINASFLGADSLNTLTASLYFVEDEKGKYHTYLTDPFAETSAITSPDNPDESEGIETDSIQYDPLAPGSTENDE